MNNVIGQISLFSVFIPFVISFFCFKKIHKSYNSFLIFVLFCTVSDWFKHLLTIIQREKYLRIVTVNISALLETIIVLWLFKQWCLFKKRKQSYALLLSLYLITWLCESLYFGVSLHVNYYFIILSEFITVLQCTVIINSIIKNHSIDPHLNSNLVFSNNQKILYSNPKFIIAIGFIIYHFLGLIPTIFLSGLVNFSREFRREMTIIPNLSITLAYLLFSYGLALMIKRTRFKMGYQAVKLKCEACSLRASKNKTRKMRSIIIFCKEGFHWHKS